MLKYNFLCQLDQLSNYGLDHDTKESKIDDLANYLHQNYNNMDEVEKSKIILKCLEPKDINKILLKYEFTHYKIVPETCLTLTEFEKEANKIIARYQWKAGGYLIEDSAWVIHKSDSKKYDVKKYEILFENTLDSSDIGDEETDFFIDRLLDHLNSLCTNITVEFRQRDTNKKTVKLLLWAQIKDGQDSDESVGL